MPRNQNFYGDGQLRTYGPITADFTGAANVDASLQKRTGGSLLIHP